MAEIDPLVLEKASAAVADLHRELERMGGAVSQFKETHESLRGASDAVAAAGNSLSALSEQLGRLAEDIEKLRPDALADELRQVRAQLDTLGATLAGDAARLRRSITICVAISLSSLLATLSLIGLLALGALRP